MDREGLRLQIESIKRKGRERSKKMLQEYVKKVWTETQMQATILMLVCVTYQILIRKDPESMRACVGVFDIVQVSVYSC